MFPKNWPQNLVHIVTSSISLSFISQSCKGALPGHNQPLRFLWPFWLPSNSKEWTIPPVWTKSPGYSRFGERRTPLVVVAWGTTASIQVNIYSFFERWGGGEAEVFGNSGQTINKSTFGDDAQGELMRRANRSSFQLEDCFPMVPEFYRAAKKSWFTTIQEVYCWRENPLLALQTEALQSWTSRKPARLPVCSFSMACCIMKTDSVRRGWHTGRSESLWLIDTIEYLSIRNVL